jgi:diguanylate cyclase (GGDEF)-like protein/PAS domain S-box-containing protein
MIVVESAGALPRGSAGALPALGSQVVLALDRVRLIEDLHRNVAHFRELFQHASDIITVIADDGAIQYHTPSTERILGYSGEQIAGGSLFRVLHPDDHVRARAFLQELAHQHGESRATSWRVRRSDGQWLQVETIGSNLRHVPSVGGIVLTSRDVSERTALQAQLAHQAYHDSLTNLPNRARLRDHLQRALLRARQRRSMLAVLFLDLDRFKVINDSLGHHVGDQLLVAVADRLRGSVRPNDLIARLGGDEFTVVLEDLAGAGGATQVAERILKQVQAPLTLDGHPIVVTTSIGIAINAGEATTLDDLLRLADIAMYRAKQSGKARYAIYDDRLDADLQDHLSLELDLRQAVEQQEFQLAYQPIVDLETGAIVAMEALIRWPHARRGPIAPLEFLPLAEELGLSARIGRWQLAEVCRQMRDWQATHPHKSSLHICVNVSAAQLLDPDLAEDILAATGAAGLDPRCLELEITENNLVASGEASIAALKKLKAIGVRLAIDDFGTGYSSLAYLKEFPIDTIKIDRTFVSRLASSPEHGAIVRAIGMLADTLKLRIVGEGIEHANQRAQLRALGCHLGQGFFFTPALPGDKAGALLTGAPWVIRDPSL